MNTYLISILIIVFGTFIGAIAAYLMKNGINKIKKLGILSLFKPIIILSATLYVISTIFNMIALKNAPMKVIYPLTSLTWVWSMLLAHFFLEEKITKNKIIGICFIITGVILII